ncbi:DUF1236 domain-containing protein [Microvirga solisilvae]|uniref:DUF1236 domain-containing protein n=1 Tax=Microvirga solisilvae TaxID=2919498 RepID=UPI001FB037FD|nr:DUF1236 domain-containing protein [Microvirga solisilvae]
MRILLILMFIGFSLGAMATLATPDETTDRPTGRAIYAEAGTLSGAVSAVRKIRSHLSASGSQSKPAEAQEQIRLKPGDRLPEGTTFHEIPRHESYRYAIVRGHRVIVDAASHQIIYILR